MKARNFYSTLWQQMISWHDFPNIAHGFPETTTLPPVSAVGPKQARMIKKNCRDLPSRVDTPKGSPWMIPWTRDQGL